MRPVTNSEIATFQTCERLWQHTYFDRRTGLIHAEALSRGTRIHRGLARWWIDATLFDFEPAPPVERAMLLGYHALYQRPHLRDVRVSVPFRTSIGGVEVVGELDAIGEDDAGSVIVEHKTTTSDITPGSQWWREKVHTDPQASTYAWAFPGARILFDVLHVPDQEQFRATPEDKRKYTKPTKSEPSRLYASQRDTDETDNEYVARILADMSDKPEKYFHRAYVVRLDSEREAFASDVAELSEAMWNPLKTRPRNPRACFAYGRECPFFAACWQGKDIESYPQREQNHSEEVLERWEKSR